MSSNSQRAIEIFTEAIHLPLEERAAFLDRVCGEDENLRRKIAALLKSNDRAAGFMEKPIVATVGAGRVEAAPGEKPGDHVGRYKLLLQIGEGGCGVVFLAEQVEPVRRRVALKVIKPGMDTKSVIARFEAERQALALMDHPNIAHVLDAGATKSGRPYFVMELVEGVKITDYCDEHALSIEARLELFAMVCNAIQHAHQKGVIHRDIKPSNVLVTSGPDRKPVPKVIDFGIAKATTGQQLTDKTIFTAIELLMGTPAYMSPEQAALSGTEVDTRTDIYSLGVLLYELLTGTTPFDARELLKAGLDEVRRVIRDEEPVRPSTRLSTMVAAELVTVSRHHGSEGPRLIREMRGDLDWIVMKALEKDRGRRYATANGLAAEIERYLGGEAILARPPSQLYRFQKAVARHKLGFAAFGIILATLIAGLSITTWSLAREKQAHHEADRARNESVVQRRKAEAGEKKANLEAARNKEVVKFMNTVLHSIDPVAAAGRDTRLLRDILDGAAERIGTELTNQPGAQAELRCTIGRAYGNLGLWDKEEPILLDALKYFQGSPEGFEEQTANTLFALSMNHQNRSKPRLVEAEEEARKALEIESKLFGEESFAVVTMKTRLALAKLARGETVKATAMLREAVATGKRLHGDDTQVMLDARNGLAKALILQHEPTEALALLHESLSIVTRKYGTNHLFAANCYSLLGFASEKEHQLGEAEAFYFRALEIRREFLPKDHVFIEQSLEALASVMRAEGKNAEAVPLYVEALELRRQRYGNREARVVQMANFLVQEITVHGNETQFEKLAAEFPQVWALRAEFTARNSLWKDAKLAAFRVIDIQPDDHAGYHLVVPLLVQTGDRAAYEEVCNKIVARFAGATDPYTADRMAKDCLILPRPGVDLKVAADLAKIAVTRGHGDSGALPYFHCCQALAEFRQSQFEEALKSAQQAYQGSHSDVQAEAAAIMAMSHFKLGQVDKAQTDLVTCNRIINTKMPIEQQDDLGESWRDWIFAHALQAEAKQMIGTETTSAESSANSAH
jgi:serine/threonine protein kinase